jgi:hypothetical protein
MIVHGLKLSGGAKMEDGIIKAKRLLIVQKILSSSVRYDFESVMLGPFGGL